MPDNVRELVHLHLLLTGPLEDWERALLKSLRVAARWTPEQARAYYRTRNRYLKAAPGKELDGGEREVVGIPDHAL